jgi:hypothetical protein
VNVGLNFSIGLSLYPIIVLESGGLNRVHAEGEERARVREGGGGDNGGRGSVGSLEVCQGGTLLMWYQTEEWLLGVAWVRNGSEWTWRREGEGERQVWMGWKYIQGLSLSGTRLENGGMGGEWVGIGQNGSEWVGMGPYLKIDPFQAIPLKRDLWEAIELP